MKKIKFSFFNFKSCKHVHAYTGLTKKDDTSESTVRNSCFLLFINCKLICSIAKSLNKQITIFMQNLTLGSSHRKSFRSSLQSHPLKVTLWVYVILKCTLFKRLWVYVILKIVAVRYLKDCECTLFKRL